MADKGMILQHQIRENSQELGDFLGDLNNWEKDIKKKDEDLKKTAAINQLVSLYGSPQYTFHNSRPISGICISVFVEIPRLVLE